MSTGRRNGTELLCAAKQYNVVYRDENPSPRIPGDIWVLVGDELLLLFRILSVRKKHGGRGPRNETHRKKIPTRNTILRWEASFRITGSTLKKKSPGRNSIALRLSETTSDSPSFTTIQKNR
ncbi:hypothetical protein ANN_25771 [Periplaneta americana]|uniref:Uncharacterized protein n=1 Tax=Periplaneta americana TaxID=6978 RepID=A0ABQ8S4B6_PERAM|nr:hypothetical protein ANN_25771 [Periplaneta americana]